MCFLRGCRIVMSMHNLLSRYRHVNWALADQAMVSAVNFLTGVLLARHLGLAEYGRFTLAWMAVLFFNSFQTASIVSPMRSIAPQQKSECLSEYYGAVFLQQCVWILSSFSILFFAIFVSGYIRPDLGLQGLALPLAVASAAYQLQDFLRRYFFVVNRASMAFINDCISYMGQIVMLLYLFRYFYIDVKLVLWVIAGTSFVAIIVGFAFVSHITFSLKAFVIICKQHWAFSKWLVGAALMQWTSGNYFLVVAGYFLSPSAVGAVKAAQNVVGITNVLFQGLENFVPSRASACYYKGGLKSLNTYMKTVISFSGGATLFIIFVLVATPGYWFSLFYGDIYSGYESLLYWYGVIYLLMLMSLILKIWLVTLGRPKVSFLAYVVMTLFSVAFAREIVTKFGLPGAMFGMFTSYVIYVAVSLFFLLKYLSKEATISASTHVLQDS